MLAAIALSFAVASAPQRTVALTFDDLPGVALPGHCQALSWNQKLLATLHAHRAPALGLVVASNACELEPVLNAWLDAGHDLGNHTFSHRDLNSTPIAQYEEDIVRGEPQLRGVLAKRGKALRYFRYPMLHTGSSPKTKSAIAGFLRDRHYVVAPVTFDNQDFVFANAYVRALSRNDTGLANRVAAAYVPYMESVVEFLEKRSEDVVGRPIAHVLLLHMSALNADALDSLLRMFERRGYRFVTTDEALRDPAYSLPDAYIGRKGLSWIHRWGLAKGMPVIEEPREPAWLHTRHPERSDSKMNAERRMQKVE
jgi:peptidoglycan/xylan/chitin deacetylase (PgdA/CDA1 family)